MLSVFPPPAGSGHSLNIAMWDKSTRTKHSGSAECKNHEFHMKLILSSLPPLRYSVKNIMKGQSNKYFHLCRKQANANTRHTHEFPSVLYDTHTTRCQFHCLNHCLKQSVNKRLPLTRWIVSGTVHYVRRQIAAARRVRIREAHPRLSAPPRAQHLQMPPPHHRGVAFLLKTTTSRGNKYQLGLGNLSPKIGRRKSSFT